MTERKAEVNLGRERQRRGKTWKRRSDKEIERRKYGCGEARERKRNRGREKICMPTPDMS